MTEWTRHGDCNHCGACCTNLLTKTVFLVAVEQVASPTSDHDDYFHVRQVPLIHLDGKDYRQYSGDLINPCQYHKENQCGIYETRPGFCRDFPTHPDQIKAMPCTYWFEAEGKVAGGQGAPPEVVLRYEREPI